MSGIIAAGRLRQRITLQTATKTRNAATGEEVVDWTTIAPVILPAEWFSASTREAYQVSDRLDAWIDGLFRIRFRDPEPLPDLNRIVWRGRVYDLKPAIDVLGLREAWDLPVVALLRASNG